MDGFFNENGTDPSQWTGSLLLYNALEYMAYHIYLHIRVDGTYRQYLQFTENITIKIANMNGYSALK